jgi:hypothetical protein
MTGKAILINLDKKVLSLKHENILEPHFHKILSHIKEKLKFLNQNGVIKLYFAYNI